MRAGNLAIFACGIILAAIAVSCLGQGFDPSGGGIGATGYASFPDSIAVSPSVPYMVQSEQTAADEVQITFSTAMDETTAETVGNYEFLPLATISTATLNVDAVGGSGSITINTVAIDSSSATGTSATVDLNTAATDDCIILIVACDDGAYYVTSVTDDIGNTYVCASADTVGTTLVPMYFYAYNSTANAANTITVTGSSERYVLTALACDGVKTSSPVGDIETQTAGSRSSYTTTDFTTTGTNSLVLMSWVSSAIRTVTAYGDGQDSLYYVDPDWGANESSFGASYEEVASAGSNEQSVTWSASSGMGIETIEFLAEPGGRRRDW